jgi:cytochrome c oxidase subunit 2
MPHVPEERLAWLGWPPAASSFAAEVDSLFVGIALVVGVWLLASEVALLVFAWRALRRTRSAMVTPSELERERRWILALAVSVLACDLAIEARGHGLWARIVAPTPLPALPILVEARQFAWLVHHPGRDGVLGTKDDIELQNEMHVPVGRPVEVRLRSRDVIHSFFLPAMRLKQDVLPGMEVRRWFVATRAGSFPLACAELCGFGHYRMAGQLVVHDPSSYEGWLGAETHQGTSGSES